MAKIDEIKKRLAERSVVHEKRLSEQKKNVYVPKKSEHSEVNASHERKEKHMLRKELGKRLSTYAKVDKGETASFKHPGASTYGSKRSNFERKYEARAGNLTDRAITPSHMNEARKQERNNKK